MKLPVLAVCLCIGFAVFYFFMPYWLVRDPGETTWRAFPFPTAQASGAAQIDFIRSSMAAVGFGSCLYLAFSTVAFLWNKIFRRG